MDLVAADIMSHPVIRAPESLTVQELTVLLQERQISGVPVVDASDQLVGVISITDLISLSAGDETPDDARESDFHTSPAMDGLSQAHGLLAPDSAVLDRPIRDFMSRHVITATEETHIGDLAGRMISHRIHRLIIVRDKTIVGIISVRDILRSLRDRYVHAADGP